MVADTFLQQQFFYNNYLNNPNFNNKNDKIKILRIRMAARHYQWRCVNASVPLTRLCKNIIQSGVFQFFYNLKLRALLTAWFGRQWEKRHSHWRLSFF
jgi:hypothetical protein